MNAAITQWFAEADLDRDGRLSPDEAKKFFTRTGLEKSVLSKIWVEVKARDPDSKEVVGLDKRHFSKFLKLVAVAQSGRELSPENIDLALGPKEDWMAKYGPPPFLRIAPPSVQAPPTSTPPIVRSPSRKAPVLPSANSKEDADAASQSIKNLTLGGQDSTPRRAVSLMDEDFTAAWSGETKYESADSLSASSSIATASSVGTSPTKSGRSRAPQRPPAPAPFTHPPDLTELPISTATLKGSTATLNAYTPFEQGMAQSVLDVQTDHPAVDRPVMPLTRSMELQRNNKEGTEEHGNELDGKHLLHIDARLPPLDPSTSAKVLFIASGNGSLWGGPVELSKAGVAGKLLQWGRTEGNVRWPEMGERQMKEHLQFVKGAEVPILIGQNEDKDCAPSMLCRASRVRVSAVYVDEVDQVLWVGDRDGYITGYGLSGPPGSLLGAYMRGAGEAYRGEVYLISWQAFKSGYVSSMCRSPVGTLWAGSNRGSLRIFEMQWKGASYELMGTRELRRGGTAIGPIMPRAHQRKIQFIVAPSGAMVMWTATVNHVAVWCAFSGIFLGEISKKTIDLRDVRDTIAPAPVQLLYQDAPRINPKEGLRVDCNGRFVSPHGLDAARSAIRGQRELANRADNVIAEQVTQFATNARQFGAQIAKTGGKGVAKLFKGVHKAGKNFIKELQDRETRVHEPSPVASEGSGSGAYHKPTGSYADDESELNWDAKEEKEKEKEDASTLGQVWYMASANDGRVWVSYSKGAVEQYTSAGKMLASVRLGTPVVTIAGVGSRVWMGAVDGTVAVYNSDATQLLQWHAAHSSVVGITAAGSRVYTLTADGGIKGWGATMPSPQDDQARTSWKEYEKQCITRQVFRVFCATWNVNETMPDINKSGFFEYIRSEVATNNDYQVASFGFQEIEMGTGSVMKNVIMEQTGQKKALERGNINSKMWCKALGGALSTGNNQWFLVGQRQLCGILVAVFARAELRGVIGEVATSHVTTGVMGGMGGNKGAVAVSFTAWRRRITIVSSHFTAHQENVEQRNRNFSTISKGLTFKRRYETHHGHRLRDNHKADRQNSGGPGAIKPNSGLTDDSETVSGYDSSDSSENESLGTTAVEDGEAEVLEQQGAAIRNSEMLVWMGDFNYRVDLDFATAIDKIKHQDIAGLLREDQLRTQLREGRAFHGMKEGDIDFLPTYKFDKPKEKKKEEDNGRVKHPYGYDSSEKQRVPSYTDRILFRGSKPFEREEGKDVGDDLLGMDELEISTRPVEDSYGLGDVTISCEAYDSLMGVMDSDHKPVFAVLKVDMPSWDHDKKRRHTSHVMKAHYKQPVLGPVTLSCSKEQPHDWKPLEEEDSDEEQNDDDDEEDNSSSSDEEPPPVKRKSGSAPKHGEATKLVVQLRARTNPMGELQLSNAGRTPARFLVPKTVETYTSRSKELQEAIWVAPSYGIVPPGGSVKLKCWAQLSDSHCWDDKIKADYEVLVSSEYASGGAMDAAALPKHRRGLNDPPNSKHFKVIPFGVEVLIDCPAPKEGNALKQIMSNLSDTVDDVAKRVVHPYEGL